VGEGFRKKFREENAREGEETENPPTKFSQISQLSGTSIIPIQ